ncbi:MAG: hypothetical protein HGB11_07390 [Chlorobiales bacterium]|nr:hypothetical protein [Chlorobiales bacterium]
MKNRHTNPLSILLLITGMLFQAGNGYAQILGEANVGDDVNVSDIFLRSIEAGISFNDLSPRSSNKTDRYKFEVDRPGFAVTFHQDEVLLYFHYSSGKLDDGKKVTFFNAGAKVDFPIKLADSRGFAVQVPVSLFTDFLITDASGLKSDDELALSSVGIGSGLGFQHSTKRYIVVLKAEAFIAFATQSFTAASGSSSGFMVNAAFQYPRLFNKIGLAISYRFHYIDTNLGENRFDYLLQTNAITAGITF